MKKLFTILILLLINALNTFSQQNIATIDGIYRGENLIVNNPFDPDGGAGFCIFDVKVNGQKLNETTNSSSFEIDFSSFGLRPGDRISIEFQQRINCGNVEIVNPHVIMVKSTFKTKSISVEDGELVWSTTGERGQLPFTVEQFKWNKWKPLGTVEGNGTSGVNDYSYPIQLHSGENRFRVKQIDYTRRPNYSEEATHFSPQTPVEFTQKGKVVTFSASTIYEIYNSYGRIVQKGEGKQVDLSKLEKGTYYLSYDNETKKVDR